MAEIAAAEQAKQRARRRFAFGGRAAAALRGAAVCALALSAPAAFCPPRAQAQQAGQIAPPAAGAPLAPGGESGAEQSRILAFIEAKLSAPNRRIRLSGVSGALSSRVSVAKITVADAGGVWLEIRNAALDWNRPALLRGALSANSLSAETVEVLRRPLPGPQGKPAAAEGFSLPQLPLAIEISQIHVRQLRLAAPVFGRAALFAAQGRLTLAGALLDADLTAAGADGSALRLAARYEEKSRDLTFDAHWSEPGDGLLAFALGLKQRPPLALSVVGGGKAGAWTGRLNLAASGSEVLSGQFALAPAAAASADAQRFQFSAEGPVAALLPAEYQPFFGAETALSLQGALKKAGGLRLDRLLLRGGGVYLSAAGETAADGFLRRLTARGAIGRSAEKMAAAGIAAYAAGTPGAATVLPAPGGGAKLGALLLDISYGAAGTDAWSARLRLNNLQTAAVSLRAARLDAGGLAQDLDNPAARSISASAKGTLSGLRLAAPGQNAAAKTAPELALSAAARLSAGQPPALPHFSLSGGGAALSAEGVFAAGQFAGAAKLAAADISPFAAVFGRPLAGAVNLSAAGKAGLRGGAFDADFSGGFSNLKTGNAALDRLLRGNIAVSGGLKRDAGGIAARDLQLQSGQFRLAANGALSAAAAQMDFSADLADIALLQPLLPQPAAGANPPQISGALSLRGALRGSDGIIALAAQAGLPKGVWNGRPARDLRLALNGFADNVSPGASRRGAVLRGSGVIGGDKLDLAAAGQQNGRAWRLSRLDVRYGASALSGFLAPLGGSGNLWSGALRLKTADLAPLAALAFAEGRGKADLSLSLSAAAGQQNIAFGGAADGLFLALPRGSGAVARFSLRHLAMQGGARDIFALPKIDGRIDGQGLRASLFPLIELKNFSLSGASRGAASELRADIQAADGARLSAAGTLAPYESAEKGGEAGLWQLRLDNLTLDGLPAAFFAPPAADGAAVSGSLRLQTASAARFVFDKTPHLRAADGLALRLQRGGAVLAAARLSGRLAGGAVAAQAEFSNLPLAAANLFRPNWGLSGGLSGAAQLSGALARPNADFDIRLRGASAAASRAAGLGAVDLSARGQAENGALTLNALLSGSGAAQPLQLALNGQADFAAQTLRLTAEGQNLPLSLAREIWRSPALAEQKLSGAVSARATAEGSFADPQIAFSARITQFSAAALAAARAAPLDISASGRLNRRAAQLDQAAAQGPGGLRLSVSGRLPYRGAGLAVQAKGVLPLALADSFLRRRGAQADGLLTVDAGFSGALSAPQMQGSFRAAQGRFVYAPLNLRLQPIAFSGRFSGEQVILDDFAARSYNGGSVSAAGTLRVNQAAGFPIDARAVFRQFGYNDGTMAALTLSGGLNLRGPLAGGAEIGGKITVDKAEIRVPDNFGGRTLPDIENRRAAPPVALTQKRAGMQSGKAKAQAEAAAKAASPMMPRLHIELFAPNQIFVRGRGLDAEMGGRLLIAGRADAIAPTGGFKLIRGRLDILAQRLVFRSGQVTLAGDFNPALDFSAVSQGSDVTVTVRVSGTPKDLKISLSSDPSLPQDEILARLIFKRSLSELSPIEAAQLVDAAAELTGLAHHSVLGRLRNATGLDQLDITTDSAGNPGVAAGRYIMDKLYLGVETAPGGTSKGTVNLDITRRLKAKGAVGSDANSDIGVFYERDY